MKFLSFLIVLTGLVALGCNTDKIEEKIAEKASEAEEIAENYSSNSQDNKEEEKPENSNEEFEQESVELPENFPEDIYISKDAIITNSLSADDAFAVEYISEKEREEIVEEYEEKMNKLGWSKDAEQNQGDKRFRLFGKKGRTTAITVDKHEKGSEVDIKSK